MIYLDNAATTYPKPFAVIRQTEAALRDYGANPGRAGHELSRRTSRMVYSAREKCARFFGTEPENTVFTLNCTHALNFAIKGVCKAHGKCHVITSDLEHNSVIRPLHRLKQEGIITYDTADSGDSDKEFVDNVKALIKKDTAVIIITAGCNVNGRIMPIKQMARLCREKNICLIADCAQSAGVLPLKITDGINIICAPGHKGLYGPMGTGILATDGKYPLSSVIEGGTGSASGEIGQPDFLPDMLESGTINTPGAIALGSGIDFVLSKGMDKIFAHETALCDLFIKKCRDTDGLTIYRSDNLRYLPVVSFSSEKLDSNALAALLSDNGFYLRGGLHCNFLAHKKQGTLKFGTVRLAPSVFNSRGDIIRLSDFLIKHFGKK